MTRLVLASASPRRRALLAAVGVPVAAVVPADVDETPVAGEGAAALARRLAVAKRDRVSRDARGDDVVLAADTVVVAAGQVLGKPVDEEDAARMLRALAGDVATVLSGLAVARRADPRVHDSGVVATFVRFRPLTATDIERYVATGEPLGAAGAFRLQGAGADLLAATSGCPTNVVGLPVCETRRLLAPAGVRLAPADCVRVVERVRGA